MLALKKTKINRISGDAFLTRDSPPFVMKGHKIHPSVKPRLERAPKIPHKKLLKIALYHVNNYCEKSSLHGLKYVGDSTLTFGERIFWLLSCLLAIGFASFFIASLYDKFNKNPIIISFSPTTVQLEEIPFPAITICNVNIAIKAKAEMIYQEGDEVQQRLLADYCNSNNSFTNDSDRGDQTAEWKTVRSFIIDINQPCNKMIKFCTWEQERLDCTFYSNAILTDEGFCCSFNRLPSNYTFRNAKMMNGLNETYQRDIIDWNLETGFPPKSPLTSLPRRLSGAGAHLGLSLVLDANLDDYFCSSTNSVGFKVSFSNPVEMPQVQDYGFLVTPGYEFRIAVKPIIKDAIPSIQSIDINKRKCFFTEERYLQFYRIYTEKNCKLECQTNYTIKKCGCVPYFLPMNLTTRICGKKLETCVADAKFAVETNSLSAGINCNCLPGCFELSYERTISHAKLDRRIVKGNLLENNTLDYFVKNMAIMHIYFDENRFVKQTKSELYGFSEFLSNTGGLLGLFLGFSFLSAIEIAYYIVVRASCNVAKKKKQENETKSQINFPYFS